MLRIVLLPLLLFTISMVCMGQTFQYSRGWTNGKRSLSLASPQHQKQQQQQQHERHSYLTAADDLIDPELYTEDMLERYFLQMPRFMRNALIARSGITLRPTATSNLNNNELENGNNNLFGSHHQSNELFEELNGAGVVDANDYGKH